MIKQPVKTSIKVDTVLAVTLQAMERAPHDPYPFPMANGTLIAFINGLAETLLTEAQQEQVKTIVMLWQECLYPGSASRQSDQETPAQA
jgi:hypothetical protein